MKKTVIAMLSSLAGAALGAGISGKAAVERIQTVQKASDKHLALFLMMNQWIKVKQEGKNLADYFEANGYKKIAIYGMSYAGEALLNELRETGITVAYGIDQRAECVDLDVDIVTADSALDEVDAIVVTAITFFDEVEKILSTKVKCPILSLEDILYKV